MICKKCHQEIENDSVFCVHCGANQNEVEEEGAWGCGGGLSAALRGGASLWGAAGVHAPGGR